MIHLVGIDDVPFLVDIASGEIVRSVVVWDDFPIPDDLLAGCVYGQFRILRHVIFIGVLGLFYDLIGDIPSVCAFPNHAGPLSFPFYEVHLL